MEKDTAHHDRIKSWVASISSSDKIVNIFLPDLVIQDAKLCLSDTKTPLHCVSRNHYFARIPRIINTCYLEFFSGNGRKSQQIVVQGDGTDTFVIFWQENREK